MIDIRRHWELYLATQNLTVQEKEALRQSFSSQMKKILQQQSGLDLSPLRSAGPLVNSEFLQAADRISKTFWSTGVTSGRSSPNQLATHINPMFAHSSAGREFNVHYGTNPISTFHLGPALAHIQGSSTPPSKVAAEDLVETAMKQLKTWNQLFQMRLLDKPYNSHSIFRRRMHAFLSGPAQMSHGKSLEHRYSLSSLGNVPDQFHRRLYMFFACTAAL